MRRILAALGLGWACALAASPVQMAASLVDLSLEQLSSIVVSTVSGREEPLARAPASVYVISAEDIRRSGALSLGEALRLALVLRSLGNEVRVEHDGAAALAAAGEFQPQIAFLDIGLPKLNGFDLARKLRALGATADTILVAVTGWGQPSDRQKAKEAGFDDYLVKPVEIDRIRALLDNKQ